LVPPLAFVRQPAKVFAILPRCSPSQRSARPACSVAWTRRAHGGVSWPLLLVAVVADYAVQVRPRSVCSTRQGAYQAVPADAARRAPPPAHRRVILPGDSTGPRSTSTYASQYRIRMVKATGRTSASRISDQAFLPFGSINVGELSGAQLDARSNGTCATSCA